jgi:hypothetical protein
MGVYFFECGGKDALGKLETIQQQLGLLPFISSTKLLKNTRQPDLFLLVVEASEEPHIALPEGARVWTFVEVVRS